MPSRLHVLLFATVLASFTALIACGSKQSRFCGLACCEPGSACPVTPSYLFATNINGQLSAFPVQPSGGLGTPVNVAGPSNVTLGLAFVNGYVYASNPDPATGSSVEGWSFNNANGSLTPVPGSPFALGTLRVPRGMAAGDAFLYIADTSSIDAFQIDTGTGSLTATPGSPFTSGSGDYLALDPQNNCCLFASDDDPPGGVMAFTVDGTTGALTKVPGSPFAANPSSSTNTVPMQLVVDSNGSFLYVSLEGTSEVAGFSIGSGGLLTPIPGSPFSVGKGTISLATASGNLLYVSNGLDQTVSGFSIDSTTGLLTRLAGSPFAISSTVLLASPWPYANVLYASGPGGIFAYSVDTSTGSLTPISGSPFPSDSPTALAYVQQLLP
jgi:6-phosphogluconolactonase